MLLEWILQSVTDQSEVVQYRKPTSHLITLYNTGECSGKLAKYIVLLSSGVHVVKFADHQLLGDLITQASNWTGALLLRTLGECHPQNPQTNHSILKSCFHHSPSLVIFIMY